MEFKLENQEVKKAEFLHKTNGKTITIESIGKLFESTRFKKTQFIIRVSCDDAEVQTKMYISPVVKNLDDEMLYFSPKSFLHPLVMYALTGTLQRRGVTVDLPTLREALEGNDYTITYDFNRRFPKIIKVE